MAGNGESWHLGHVAATTEVADTIRQIVIATDRVHRAEPGSHVDIRIGPDMVRSYSIVECRDGGRSLVLGVHLSPSSRGGSTYMHTLEPGDDIELTAPRQNFPLRIGAERYVLVAGGIGITAVAAMAAVLRRLGADYTLVYVGRSRSAMAFLPELQSAHGEHLRVHIDDEDTPLDVPALIEEIAGRADADRTELYMCGPIRLMDAVRRAWNNAELPPTNLRYETFGNSGWFSSEEFIVRIPSLGTETTVSPNESVLDALERSGVEIMYDCRKGECGLCRVGVLDLDGEIDHRDVFFSQTQKSESTRLCACVSRVIRGSASSQVGVLTLDLP